MNPDDLNPVESYLENMDQREKDAFRFGLTFMVSEIAAYLHQLLDQDKTINHELLTSMEHHYLRDLTPDKFDETLRLILQK
ncbi:MAG: hypothetical protein KDD94_00225 [Calditrichaeota bacterium]|nr:hypothetical protein [Calditrichota bacterium]